MSAHLQSPQMLGYIIGAATAAAAASAAGYQCMSPTGQWYGASFIGLHRESRKLAFTYDDGPNDPHTFRLLEILAKHQVHATFFLIGQFAAQRPDIAREVLKAGHAIGNHTFSHPNLVFSSAKETRTQLERCQKTLSDALGQPIHLFRPPFGGRRPGTFQIARQLGLEPVMWSVTGWDWKGKPAQYVEQKVEQQVRGGDVVLLHDGGHEAFGADRSQTVIATDHLIPRFKAAGYDFLTIPQMMSAAKI